MGDVAALTWPLTRPGGPLPLPSNRARRCLFGPVDHEKAKLHLEQQMGKILQQDRLRWNFDFETGRPLKTGRYIWEKLGGGDPSDADSSGGSETQEAEEESAAKQDEQTHITDFMRKRKSSNQKDFVTQRPKTRRRSST